MTAAENKRLFQEIFAGLSVGNGRIFFDSLSDDFSCTVMGTTEWSKTYRGKEVVRNQLMKPLFAQFADTYKNELTRIIAEDDYVVVECRGSVTTKEGKPYNNSYCWVCRVADGKIKELTEYSDTDLIRTALQPPQS